MTDLTNSLYAYTTFSNLLHGKIKIGKTTQTPEERIKQQQTGNPEELQIIFEGEYGEYEKRIHDYVTKKYPLSQSNVSGGSEWFEIDDFKIRAKKLELKSESSITPAIISDLESLFEEKILHPFLSSINKNNITSSIILKPHQREMASFVESVNFYEKPKKGEERKILLDMKCRSGKTICAVYICHELINRLKRPINVMINSSIPSQTEEFVQAFQKYIPNVECIDSKNLVPLSKTKTSVVCISFQDAKSGRENPVFSKAKFTPIEKEKFDLIIVDEVHFGAFTERSKELLKSVHHDRLVCLSATPFKQRGEFKHIFTYNTKDEEVYKVKFPEEYKNIPTLKYLLVEPNDVFKFEDEFNSDEMFTWAKALQVDEFGNFVYESWLREFLTKMTSGDTSGKKMQRNSCIPLDLSSSDSILITTPSVAAAHALKSLLEDLINSNSVLVSVTTADTKTIIGNSTEGVEIPLAKARWEAHSEKGKKNIIIVCGQLRIGHTIPCIGTVIMMDDCHSLEQYIQTSYRPQNPFKKNGKDRKECYVYDLCPSRFFELRDELKSECNSSGITFDNYSMFENVDILKFGFGFKKINDIDHLQREAYPHTLIEPKMRRIRLLAKNISIAESNLLFNVLENFDGLPLNTVKKISVGDENLQGGKNRKTSILKEKKEKTNSLEEKINEYIVHILNNCIYVWLFSGMKFNNLDDVINDIDLIGCVSEDTSKEKLFLLVKSFIPDVDQVGNTLDIDAEDVVPVIWEFHIKKILAEANKENHIDDLFLALSKVKKMNHNHLIEEIQKYLSPSKHEVKKRAEVFTPSSLIEKMLDKLPNDVWQNPNLKWLDPANGIGNFPAHILSRLMKGLESHFPNEEQRKRHVLENMIYVADIQPKNMFIYHLLFNPNNDYKLNFFTGDFLSDNFDAKMKEWGIEKFDVIVGNPPYQNQSKTNKLGAAVPTWTLFVNKDFQLLKKDGFLVNVHPSLWRQVGDKKAEVLREKQILFLSINDENAGKKMFGMETRFDWYVAQNCEITKKTEIKDQKGCLLTISLKGRPFIPNCDFDSVFSLIATKDEKKVELSYSASFYHTQKPWMHEEVPEGHNGEIIKCVYSIAKGGELKFRYSTENKGMLGVPNVIIPPGRISSVTCVSDPEGRYGKTQFCHGLICSRDEILKLENALNSQRFREIMKACSVSKLEYNRKVISLFRNDFWKEFVDDLT